MADVPSPSPSSSAALRQGDSWRPLSARMWEEGEEPEPLFEDCPPFLDFALREWTRGVAYEGLWRRIAMRFRLAAHPAGWEAAVTSVHATNWMLDVVDAVLHYYTLGEEPLDPYDAAELDQILLDAGSAWEMSDRADQLQRRVDETVQRAHLAAREGAAEAGRPAAAERLQKAWAAVFGRHPDPGAAYRHAVAAVEDVACPKFLPQDPGPTLGKVRAHLAQSAHLYEMVISDSGGEPAPIDGITAMVGLLWHGQRDRHEGGPTSAPITQEAAEEAVHIAGLLVTTFASGALQRRPSGGS
ncbi:hypothetical protein [Streptomyces sp. NPDC002952]|uniref:hypothetical protein n=1 Tax=Streptomyces sp. NPDC002952 TaxID=3364673 RepID=UPI003684C8E6